MAVTFGATTNKWQLPKAGQSGNMPAAPRYTDPLTGKPLANTSAFWAANKFNPSTTEFQANTGNMANRYLGGALEASPFSGGGGWEGAMSRFGGGYPNINNPATKAAISAHMGNLSGDRNAQIQSAARSLASASRVPSGFMPAGGVDPRSAAIKSALDTTASQYRGDYSQAMDYLYKNADLEANSRNALANLLGTQMSTGAGLNSQVLQAIGMDQAGLADWQKSAGAAYGSDVGAVNSAIMSEYGRQRQRTVDRSNDTAKMAMASERGQQNAMLKQLLSQPQLGYSTPVTNQWMDYLRNAGVYQYRDSPKASGPPIQNIGTDSGQKQVADWRPLGPGGTW